jgi:Arc/MetJ-type ribon-helix-helix transcriptional regulator
MDIILSAENEQFVQQEIATGVYRDCTDAMNAGVELLRQRKRLLAKLDEGRRQLDSGQYSEYDEQGLREFFNDVHRRGMERRRAAKAPGKKRA